MELYGYEIDSDLDAPFQLGEITISSNPKELKQLAAFLLDVAEKIETHGTQFGHEHFSDYVGVKMDRDLIIVPESGN